jgi:hypothetical protein
MPVVHMPMEQVSPLMKRKSSLVVDLATDGWSKRPKSDLTTRTTTFTTHVPDPLSSPSLPHISPRHYSTPVETTTAGMPPPSPHAKNVICPYFNIPSNVVTKEPWEACVRICSENINRFATNVLYQRRKSMKSAMELACSARNRDDKTHEAHKKEAENAIQHIWIALAAGESLPILLEKVDYYLALANTYQNEIAKSYLSVFRGTISTLIDKGESTSLSPLAFDVTTETANAQILESIHNHRAIQAYWQGHSKRCQYYIGKLPQKSSYFGKLSRLPIVFIHGMNSLQLIKCKPSPRLLSISKKAIKELKTAASLSGWNFSNKVRYDELMLIFLFSSLLMIFLISSSLCCNTYPLGSFVRS